MNLVVSVDEHDLSELFSEMESFVQRVVKELREEISVSDIASDIDLDDLAERFDASDIADYISDREVAEYIDVEDVATAISVDDVANCVMSNDAFILLFVDAFMESDVLERMRAKLRDDMAVWFAESVAPEMPKKWRKKWLSRLKKAK